MPRLSGSWERLRSTGACLLALSALVCLGCGGCTEDKAPGAAAGVSNAERVKQAGLDGIELECYGHLIDQFWSPLTNRRTDEYGGSLDNRLRFGWRVIDAIRQRVGPDYVMGVRMVCDEQVEGGITRAEGLEIARRLVAMSDVVAEGF